MLTPEETSKECPDFKYAPPFIVEDDVTVASTYECSALMQ